MKRKMIGILFCLLLFGALIPIISASQSGLGEIQRFNSCYIVAEGELTEKDFPSIVGTSMWKICYLRPFNDDRATVFYWFIRFKDTATVTLYTEENGEVLWQHQGTTVPQLRMLRFNGNYIPELTEDGRLYIQISGSLTHVQIIEK
jgi:hypothetical protein